MEKKFEFLKEGIVAIIISVILTIINLNLINNFSIPVIIGVIFAGIVLFVFSFLLLISIRLCIRKAINRYDITNILLNIIAIVMVESCMVGLYPSHIENTNISPKVQEIACIIFLVGLVSSVLISIFSKDNNDDSNSE